MNDDLIGQLHELGVEGAGKLHEARRIVGDLGQRRSRELRDLDAREQAGHLLQRELDRQAACRHRVGNLQHRRSITRAQGVEDVVEIVEVDGAEHVAHECLFDPPGSVGDRLIEQGQGIAHAARRGACDQRQCSRLGEDRLGDEDVLQVRGNRRHGHLLEVELQTARQHRHRNLLRIGRRQDELDVLGRLLERLQHRVEGRARQHVHFVDHVDLEATTRRRIDRVLEELAHLLDLGVGRGVDFEQVHEAAAVDFLTRGTDATGSGRNTLLAVERLGEDARQRRLADATGSGEQIRMMQALLGQRVFERPDHVLLADETGKRFRTPLARQDLITHARNISRSGSLRSGRIRSRARPDLCGGANGRRFRRQHLARSANAPRPRTRATSLAAQKRKWRALPPALAYNGCGCFLPDLTRLTALQCGETRRCE